MEEINTAKGKISILNDKNVLINDAYTFLEIIYTASSETLLISKENLTESFFELKTGIAGEILQKVSNYKVRLIIIGDFNNIRSKSLNDFIYESNKMGRVIFTDELNKAIELLK
jgi:hypothetical protein